MVVIVLLLVAAFLLMPFGLDMWENFLFPQSDPCPSQSSPDESSELVQPLHPAAGRGPARQQS